MIMFKSFVVLASFFVAGVAASFDKNIVYRAPFKSAHDKLSVNTRATHETLVRRQIDNATGFSDEHYPTFYGSDMSNAPFVWSGGVNFTHAVASGDPFDTSVLLWTRAAPASESGASSDQSVPICVAYAIAPSEGALGSPIDAGQAFTSYDVDWTVKVEATGLEPDTKYFYQFSDCTDQSTVSPVGKTRTIASPDTDAGSVNGGNPLTIAVFSCSQYQAGWFNAYGFAATNTSAELYVHLGDYIYESLGNGAPIGRETLGRELATIHDYRQRLNQYRTDPGLLQAHLNAPWVTVWDDHEVADNAWKAGTADSNDTEVGCAFSPSGACFTDRKLAAVRAYHEWMPIRQVDPDNQLRVWRNFQIGKLLDLTMLDTRQYDRDLTDVYYNTEFVESIADFPNRSLMGADQENWFLETLSESKSRGATWRVVGQQIVFTSLDLGGSLNVDAWDGYRANRMRVLEHLYSNSIDNTVILSGDSHANWVSDLARPNDTSSYDPISGDGAVGVEFAGTAVSSGSSFGSVTADEADQLSALLVSGNVDLQWSEGFYRGFFTLTITPEQMNASYYAMRNITNFNLEAFNSATFIVNAGENKLARPVAGGEVLAGALKSNSSSS